MKEWIQDLLASVLMGLILPGILLNGVVALWNQSAIEPEIQVFETTAQFSYPVRIRQGEETATEDLESYLVGVVLAEMPGWFEPEALKAQAVVARTYARKAWESGGKHRDGSVCQKSSCCQGYKSEENYLIQGGRPEYVEKIRAAVLETAGQVLTYDGILIEATYFSCSGGRTEDAAAVWGTDFPYLQSVDSPGEEGAAHYRDEAVFTPAELETFLGITLSGAPESWIGPTHYTEGGGVDTIIIGQTQFTGPELRSLLGLKSAAFSVSTGKDTISFTTRGYGHRVGMSQYGADAMAAAGSSYPQILAHYYQGTVLTQLEPDSESVI